MVERNNIYWEYCACLLSLPSRKCGLKFCSAELRLYLCVTSFAEVWIEIRLGIVTDARVIVTSFAEVWIEILLWGIPKAYMWSLPSRKCGLKSNPELLHWLVHKSLPSRKCGLKSRLMSSVSKTATSHFLRGSVD